MPSPVTKAVVKGDQFVFPTSEAPKVFVRVTRTAKDGSWADIDCFTWAVMWSKRQALPMPGERYDWTEDEVWASGPPGDVE